MKSNYPSTEIQNVNRIMKAVGIFHPVPTVLVYVHRRFVAHKCNHGSKFSISLDKKYIFSEKSHNSESNVNLECIKIIQSILH